MNFRTLIFRSLRFHWRAHLGVVLGAAVGSAALIGALVVGDSVRGSLREMALQRLGWVHFAMAPDDGFFTSALPEQNARANANADAQVDSALSAPWNRRAPGWHRPRQPGQRLRGGWAKLGCPLPLLQTASSPTAFPSKHSSS